MPVALLEPVKRRLRQTRAYDWLLGLRARRELSRWTEHDSAMRAFYAGLIRRGDLCFDVGANMGNRVKVFLALDARVVAVEPQQRCARALRSAFGRVAGFQLVEKALGACEGSAEIRLGDAHTLSSLSPQWIDAVSKSGRFADRSWDRAQRVAVTTLDRLIEEHGLPDFVKIDVEGFELEVVKGLSRPVRSLSLEYTPECTAATIACLEHLAGLAPIACNLSLGESMRFDGPWISPDALAARLWSLQHDATLYGDVYVRSR